MSINGIKEEENSSPNFFRNKYEYKDFETYQQALLVGLLNKKCSFVIKRQRKQSVLTSGMPTIKAIRIEDEDLNLVEISDMLCRPQLEHEYSRGLNKQTAFRRYEKNKKVFLINTLYDICLEFGYFFDSKLARKSKKTKRLDRIENVFYQNKLVIDQQGIIRIGTDLNKYFLSLISSRKEVIIQKNDIFISSLFNSIVLVCFVFLLSSVYLYFLPFVGDEL